MNKKINIKDFEFYKEHEKTITYLIENYYNLPINENNYITLTKKEYEIITTLYNILIHYEHKIYINMENSNIFNKIEQLYTNSIEI